MSDHNSDDSKVVSIFGQRSTAQRGSSPSGTSNSELEFVLGDISRAHNAELYYVAIAIALSLPDICAALESDPNNPWTSQKSYIKWFENNLADRFKILDAENCYRLRCGVLHQGKNRHSKLPYERVLFVPPGPLQNTEGLMKDMGNPPQSALVLGSEYFCNTMVNAVRDWYSCNCENPNVQANMPKLVSWRPMGVSPFMDGLPVIA